MTVECDYCRRGECVKMWRSPDGAVSVAFYPINVLGPCARCDFPSTVRYGPHGRPLCRACHRKVRPPATITLPLAHR